MATRTKQLQRVVQDYIDAGKPWPATAHEIATWAVNSRRWQPQPSALINQCADQIAQAMREEYITDPQGRKVRAKHVVREERNGKMVGFWDDMRWTTTSHMQIAAQQRRQQIVGDCRQLKTDIDSYNENYNKEKPIQMSFNFTHDLEELELETRRSRQTTTQPNEPVQLSRYS